jgi:hypothetical protein
MSGATGKIGLGCLPRFDSRAIVPEFENYFWRQIEAAVNTTMGYPLRAVLSLGTYRV